jgi:hypothetical protein
MKNIFLEYLPKCCIKYDADMLKNLCKATRFDYDTHDNTPLESPLNKGGLRGCCAFWIKAGWPGYRTIMCCWQSFSSISAS